MEDSSDIIVVKMEDDGMLPSSMEHHISSQQMSETSNAINSPNLSDCDADENHNATDSSNDKVEYLSPSMVNERSSIVMMDRVRQLYLLGDEPGRKEFLDDYFEFMRRRDSPVVRIPTMAKQPLDLYKLYKTVTALGGLEEVIKNRQWSRVTRELNLPPSITSAAFTLRTQYFRYLYAYECSLRSKAFGSELPTMTQEQIMNIKSDVDSFNENSQSDHVNGTNSREIRQHFREVEQREYSSHHPSQGTIMNDEIGKRTSRGHFSEENETHQSMPYHGKYEGHPHVPSIHHPISPGLHHNPRACSCCTKPDDDSGSVKGTSNDSNIRGVNQKLSKGDQSPVENGLAEDYDKTQPSSQSSSPSSSKANCVDGRRVDRSMSPKSQFNHISPEDSRAVTMPSERCTPYQTANIGHHEEYPAHVMVSHSRPIGQPEHRAAWEHSQKIAGHPDAYHGQRPDHRPMMHERRHHESVIVPWRHGKRLMATPGNGEPPRKRAGCHDTCCSRRTQRGFSLNVHYQTDRLVLVTLDMDGHTYVGELFSEEFE